MNMSLKQKALLKTLKLMGSGLLTGLVVSLMFTYLSVTTLFTVLGLAVFGYLCYMVYAINLSQLESLDRLNKANEKV